MANSKRRPEQETADELGNVHSSRKKRVKYTEEDAQLAQIYNDLADEVQAVRIKAAGDLLKNLSIKLPDSSERLDTAETRLIRGLCSGRKAARLGFSIALAELFRLKFGATSGGQGQEIDLGSTLVKISTSTETEGRASGQEKRENLLGRRFAFQAILQSDVGLSDRLQDAQWKNLMHSIFQLAGQKQWLRRECGVMLFEYLSSAKGAELNNLRVRCIVEAMIEAGQAKTPEGVGLWVHIQARVEMPEGIWHKNNPLSSKERSALTKIMLASGTNDENQANDVTSKKSTQGTRESIPTFAWRVILNALCAGKKHDDSDEDGFDHSDFDDFWRSVVAETMFTSTSSTERKALGLQVFQLALRHLPLPTIQTVVHPNIIRCIVDQRADPDRYLFDAAKVALNELVARTTREPKTGMSILHALLEYGGINFDQLTKTKTVESILSHAEGVDLTNQTGVILHLIDYPGTADHAQVEIRRRMLADLLLSTVRSHSVYDTRLAASSVARNQQLWVLEVLESLVRKAYGPSKTYPLISEASQAVFRSRIMSVLNILLNQPLDVAVTGLRDVATRVYGCANLPYSTGKREIKSTLRRADMIRVALPRKSDTSHGVRKAASQAFELLFALCIIQVYNQEPDSVAALEDLITCHESQGKSSESTTVLVELLLSFISKPSAVFRKLAEQVFSAFAAEVTAESLQSLIDILGQRESLGGQQELFDQNDDQQVESDKDSDNGSALDVEDASDVELVNGHHNGGAESESEGDDDDSDPGISTDAEEGASAEDDEEAAFDKKLAEALGTAGEEGDSDDDGSDMDDDQMMALEPHLTSIFKEKKKTTSKKQEKKDAKDNIVNFKNRVLDLLMIYVKSQYANELAIDLIHPLTVLVRTTTSKPTSEKAFNVLKTYFEACTKNKSLPKFDQHKAGLELLSAIHEEMKLGGSKLHANACSRSSLFLSKVLVTMDPKHYQKIAEMYSKLQSEWYLDPKSKVQGSVFTEWTSWSISTRKQVQ